MSVDFAVTYTSVHSKARSWSIPSEDPYEEVAQQLLEQAPRSPEYVPEDHVPSMGRMRAARPSTYHSLLHQGPTIVTYTLPNLLAAELDIPELTRRSGRDYTYYSRD
ncbi:hypothetical protein Tco_1086751 [Tanacetum coccineum]